MKRLGEDVGDLVLRLNVFQMNLVLRNQIAKIVVFQKHVTNLFCIDRIFGLRNTRCVVFHDRSGLGLTNAEFLKKLSEMYNGSSSVESCDVLGFCGRLCDDGLEIGAPVDERAAKVDYCASGALCVVDGFSSP